MGDPDNLRAALYELRKALRGSELADSLPSFATWNRQASKAVRAVIDPEPGPAVQ